MSVWLRVATDMVRRPWYYRNSAWIRTYRAVSRQSSFNGTVFANAGRDLSAYDSIVFFSNDRIMHVGDQLFFMPLIFKLIARGYPVSVHAVKALSFLFPKDVWERPVGKRPLFVIHLPMMPNLRRRFGTTAEFIAFDTLTPMYEPIGLHFLRRFRDYFQPADISRDVTPEEVARYRAILPLPAALEPLRGRPLVIFANYMDSGKALRSPATAERMLREIREYRRETGRTVVHLGTANDRDNDLADYSDLVDVDLRGRTSIGDLFAMFGNLDIDRVFTRDTGVLHIARIYGLPLNIYWKGRKTKERWTQIMRAHIHFFDESVFAKDGPPAIEVGWPP